MPLINHFPSKLVPREIQKDILDKIEQEFNSGYKKIVLSAPTGVGKSAIAVSLAKHFGESFIVTASKNLQDQYTKDYSILHAVKGKQNFPCLKLLEKNMDDPKLTQYILELTCDKGVCIENKHTNPVKYCKFKPLIENIAADGVSENMCEYYNQKYLGLVSNHSLWNYYSYFQLMINKDAFLQYIQRPVAIFDEAHKIEDQILNFIGISITQKQLEECFIDITRYKLDDIEIVLQLIDDMRRAFAKLYADIKLENIEDARLARYDQRVEKYARTYEQISEDKENFVINEPKINDIGGEFVSIQIQPLDISKHVEHFFQTENQIFMSATIDKNSFCETMGYDLSDIAFVDTPKSPFPLENRKVNFLDVKRMNARSTPEDELLIVKTIDELLDTHATERGLILTSSIKKCNFIKNHLSDTNSKRVRLCHATNPDQKTQDQVISEHASDPTGVLLSSSLWEGVDLKDDLSRFQIIAKIPYPPLKEKRTILKNQKYPLWYNSQTLMKLLQGFGRSIRSEEDYAKTYVLDSSHHYLLSKTRNILPKAYHDIFHLSE